MNISIESKYKKALLKHSDIERELQSLPHGYISKKVIHGKTQYYLQRRVDKRIIGKYIPDAEVETVKKGLLRRTALREELLGVHARISELESAARLIDTGVYNKLLLLKACVPMERLTLEERHKASSFAGAMNAVEGVHSTTETQSAIRKWIAGEVSFLSVYENTLKRYGFPVKGR